MWSRNCSGRVEQAEHRSQHHRLEHGGVDLASAAGTDAGIAIITAARSRQRAEERRAVRGPCQTANAMRSAGTSFSSASTCAGVAFQLAHVERAARGQG